MRELDCIRENRKEKYGRERKWMMNEWEGMKEMREVIDKRWNSQ